MNAPLPEAIRKALESVTLDDKYALETGRAFMSGVQALVRLPMLQRKRDAMAGLNTAGFISGYRGSPLGGYDQALWAGEEAPRGAEHRLPAGRQRGARRDRRLGHAAARPLPADARSSTACSASGTARARASTAAPTCSSTPTWPAPSKHGGVIAIAGDDHIAKSSTAAHQSDHIFKACGLPVFFPSQRAGHPRHGPARVRDEPLRRRVVGHEDDPGDRRIGGQRARSTRTASTSSCPRTSGCPPGGLHIRWPDAPLEQEARLMDYKWYAALAYVRANRLNHNVIEGPNDRFGIIASGKAYNDTRQALHDLGLDDDDLPAHRHPPAQGQRRLAARGDDHARLRAGPAGDPGRRGEAPGHRVPAQGRALQLAPRRAPARARQVRRERRRQRRRRMEPGQPERALAAARAGRPDAGDHRQGDRQAAEASSASTADIAARMDARIALIDAKETQPRRRARRRPAPARPASARRGSAPAARTTPAPACRKARAPWPASAATTWRSGWTARTVTFTQMGGEGVSWVGQAPFTTDKHMFANLGDGTYFHSGLLAIRQAIAAGSTSPTRSCSTTRSR